MSMKCNFTISLGSGVDNNISFAAPKRIDADVAGNITGSFLDHPYSNTIFGGGTVGGPSGGTAGGPVGTAQFSPDRWVAGHPIPIRLQGILDLRDGYGFPTSTDEYFFKCNLDPKLIEFNFLELVDIGSGPVAGCERFWLGSDDETYRFWANRALRDQRISLVGTASFKPLSD